MRHFHEVELVALRRVAPRRAAYVFSGRRSSPHGVPALAGRATEVLGYWAWPETQPAKAGTPCIERRGHANHIQSGATAGRGGPFRPLHADGLVAARQAPPATN